MPAKPAKYADARDVERIADRLIRECFPELEESGAIILFAFATEPIKIAGKEVSGRSKKIAGPAAYHAMRARSIGLSTIPEAVFSVELNASWWREMSEMQREAAVYRELCHLETIEAEDGAHGLKIRQHDFAGFYSELDRYGLLFRDFQDLAEKVKPHLAQQSLPLDGIEVSVQEARAAVDYSDHPSMKSAASSPQYLARVAAEAEAKQARTRPCATCQVAFDPNDGHARRKSDGQLEFVCAACHRASVAACEECGEVVGVTALTLVGAKKGRGGKALCEGCATRAPLPAGAMAGAHSQAVGAQG